MLRLCRALSRFSSLSIHVRAGELFAGLQPWLLFSFHEYSNNLAVLPELSYTLQASARTRQCPLKFVQLRVNRRITSARGTLCPPCFTVSGQPQLDKAETLLADQRDGSGPAPEKTLNHSISSGSRGVSRIALAKSSGAIGLASSPTTFRYSRWNSASLKVRRIAS